MYKNFFTAASTPIANAALESQVADTVEVSAIQENVTLQPKVGFREEGEEPSEDKVTKEIGSDEKLSIRNHDEIDTVAESQEHVLALEHLSNSCLRFARMAAALEEIADVAEQKLDNDETMDPASVAMVTQAIDANGIGEPMADSVAMETFDMSARVATESFVEALKDRASKMWTAVAKFMRKAAEITHQKLKRFADHFRNMDKVFAKLEKEGEILNSYSGKPFQNAKWEKDLQESIYAPSSTKSIMDAIRNSAAEVDQVSKIVNGKLASDLATMKTAWRTEKAETVVAQMNRVLANLKQLDGIGTKQFRHAAYTVEVNLPASVTLADTGGLDNLQLSYEDADNEFSAGIKTATMAEIKAARQFAEKGIAVLNAAWGNYYDANWADEQDAAMKTFYEAASRGEFSKEKQATVRKLATKYTNLLRLTSELCNAATFSTAEGMYSNLYAATKWGRYSIAEAKAAARGD